MAEPRTFLHGKHVVYFANHLKMLSHHYSSADTNRMTLAYFCVSGLDVLGALHTALDAARRKSIIEWVYAQQVLPDEDGKVERCGFRGCPDLGVPFDAHGKRGAWSDFPYDTANLAMTYTALAILRILGDDLSRVDSASVIAALRHMQQEDGR